VPPFLSKAHVPPKESTSAHFIHLKKHIYTSPPSINILVSISQLERVYCAVRAEHLNRLVHFRLFLFFGEMNKSLLLAQDNNGGHCVPVTSVTLDSMLTSSVQSRSLLRTECISML
jgi:hypothetical protein